ncbi:hypothetical protein F66182_6416 [Fusarium sp. NRRL 66182]|nr:hypothetical protein F66182_6416 [Fusarium sp. NRRL 66182]
MSPPSRASSTPRISKACVPCQIRKVKCNAAVAGLPCGSCPQQPEPSSSRHTTNSSHSGPAEESIHATDTHTGSSLRNESPVSRDRHRPRQTQADLLYLNILQDTVNDTSTDETDTGDHHSNHAPDDDFNTQVHRWNPQQQLDDIDSEYLAKKRVFELPPPRHMDAIVKAYFDYVHPYAPILDRTDFVHSYQSGTCCLFLLHAISAAVSLYVSEDVTMGCGYADRSAAQTAFFSKAKLFHDFDCQGDPLAMLQGSVILGAIILDHPSDRDFQYWFHNSVRRACKLGIQNAFHRDDRSQKLYRRIWWVLHNRDIFHILLNTHNIRLLESTAPFKILTVDDWEPESLEKSSGLLSPTNHAQKASLIAHCELAQIFGDVMSVITGVSPSAEDIYKRIQPLDPWRAALTKKMQLAPAFEECEIYHLEALTTSYRFECITYRLLLRGRWQLDESGLCEWAQRRFRTAVLELDTIVKRVMINNMIKKLPTTFITTITALLALHMESALRSSESDLGRSMARISIQYIMLALDQIRDTPAIKRALPAFETVLSKNKLYSVRLNDAGQMKAMNCDPHDDPLNDGHILPSAPSDINVSQDEQSFLCGDSIGFDFLDRWQMEQLDFTGLRDQDNKAIRQHLEKVEISTADSSHGKEAEVCIFLTAVTKASGPGFVKDPRRLNVGLTRHTDFVFGVGDISTMDPTNSTAEEMIEMEGTRIVSSGKKMKDAYEWFKNHGRVVNVDLKGEGGWFCAPRNDIGMSKELANALVPPRWNHGQNETDMLFDSEIDRLVLWIRHHEMLALVIRFLLEGDGGRDIDICRRVVHRDLVQTPKESASTEKPLPQAPILPAKVANALV